MLSCVICRIFKNTFLKTAVSLQELFVIFKPLSYCFEETIGFDVKASSASYLVSRLIKWYNKRILRKVYSVPREFSCIEIEKL